MRQSNYNKRPVLQVPLPHGDEYWQGWEALIAQLDRDLRRLDGAGCHLPRVVVECYPGVFDHEIRLKLSEGLKAEVVIDSHDAFRDSHELDQLVAPYLGGDDPVFGRLAPLTMSEFLDPAKLEAMQGSLDRSRSGVHLIVGPAALLVCPSADILIFADMPRWEGQLRQRRNEVSNLGVENKTLKASLQYKRSFFIDWRVADRVKKATMSDWDYLLDTSLPSLPKLISGQAHLAALAYAASRPFRVVPFFDPGPWGGQWMKEVCDLDKSEPNYAWCFDCVPEENSLLLGFSGGVAEIPSINVVFGESIALLGESVFERFGAEFPIRFDFLDTMQGGCLSLQVHPTNEFIRQHFGMSYTQDESYYILDAGEDASVWLGRKADASQDGMFDALRQSSDGKVPFESAAFAARWPARQHDHFLIPAGTLHCSGANCMVLEISATPYIFTFKLWDWGQVGLDGKPRPINLERGQAVIDWSWTEEEVQKALINPIVAISAGDGWQEEQTGLHASQFIETRRHWFTSAVDHHTKGTLNVLNLIQGREVIVESPLGAFEPFHVHYAETFIVPASVGPYTIRPLGEGMHATLKAYVR